MPKISDHEEFLNASMVKDGSIVVLLDEGAFKDPEETGLQRTVFQIRVGLPDQRKKIWTMNKTTQRRLAEAYGDDTASWVKKQVRIELAKQNVRGEMKNVIYGHPVESVEVEQTQMRELFGDSKQFIKMLFPYTGTEKAITDDMWNSLSDATRKDLESNGLIENRFDIPYFTEKARQFIE